MNYDDEIMDDDEVVREQLSRIPQPVPPPEPEKPKDELAYLFEVPQPEDNDMDTEGLLDAPDEGDLSDLVDVTDEDIMGEAPRPKHQYRITRVGRRNLRESPSSMGGMQY